MPSARPSPEPDTAPAGNRSVRHPAAWWAAGRLELRWAGRKRIDHAIDGAAADRDLVRIWGIEAGQALIEHGGRSLQAAAGSWLVLPGAVARQCLPAGTVLRSLGLAWRDGEGRTPLAGLPPWIVPPLRARSLERIVVAVERWILRHGERAPHAGSPRSANRLPVSAAEHGRLQLHLGALLDLLLAEGASATGRPADPAIERALTALRAHAAGAYPGTAVLAAAAGLGPRRFQQRFTAATGLAPRDWHQRLRLDEACRLLSGPDPVVKGIAFQLGFSGSAAFRRWFHAGTGGAPLSWRRRSLGL